MATPYSRGEAELRGEGRDGLEPVRRRVNPTTPPRDLEPSAANRSAAEIALQTTSSQTVQTAPLAFLQIKGAIAPCKCATKARPFTCRHFSPTDRPSLVPYAATSVPYTAASPVSPTATPRPWIKEPHARGLEVGKVTRGEREAVG